MKTAMRVAFEKLNNPYGVIRESLRKGRGITPEKDWNVKLSYQTYQQLSRKGVKL